MIQDANYEKDTLTRGHEERTSQNLNSSDVTRLLVGDRRLIVDRLAPKNPGFVRF
jgi:hypothetical protein